MRKLLVLWGVVLCLSMTAAAQDDPAAFDTSSPASEPAAPVSFHPPERQPWQLGIGYQYQHYKILGQTFHNNGLHTDLTRYLNDWFGIEGAAVMGFGNTGTPLNLTAKSFFIGGGPHIAFHNTSRFEPWVHGLVGWQHFRFTQTSGILGSNSALGFMVGGGVDFKLRSRVFWRIQGDYIGTRFQSATQSNYSFGTGLVFNF
jgi:opacity protein-like surface antigen